MQLSLHVAFLSYTPLILSNNNLSLSGCKHIIQVIHAIISRNQPKSKKEATQQNCCMA